MGPHRRIFSRLPLLLAITAGPAVGILPAAAQVTISDMGSGLGWIDCDGDGQVDIVYLTPQGGIVLMLNNGDGTFTDATENSIPAGMMAVGDPALGIVAGDVNNDGASDFFVTHNGPNFLLVNDGAGHFASVSRKAGISGEALSASAAMFDYDGDGLLDIYVTNYMGADNQLFHALSIDENGVPHYEEVGAALGVAHSEVGSNWGLGVTTSDFDRDGDVDLYVANDYNGPNPGGFLNPGTNVYFRNNGDGTFTDATVESGLGDTGWAMGVAQGDFDNDGWMDIFVANFFENALYRNNGDGTFTNVSRDVGLITDAPDEWHYNSWGTSFIDFDNDGDLDLHVANGFIPNDQGQVEDEPDQLWENLGRDGSGNYRFVEIGAKAGVAQIGDSRGAAYGDYDGDGLVDIFVINNDYLADANEQKTQPARCFFINQGNGTFRDLAHSLGFRTDFADGNAFPGYRDYKQNHWLDVSLAGKGSGLGATITVRAGGKTWVRSVGGGSYCSQNSPYEHFGLGAAAVVDEVVVDYVSGGTARLTDVAVDRVVTATDPATPVRLLAFDLRSEPAGVRMTWRYNDDGDLALFRVTREDGGVSTVVGGARFTERGKGTVLDTDAPTGRLLTYRLDAILRDGTVQQVRVASLRREPSVRMALGPNFPNPFAGSTTVPVSAPAGGTVSMRIFDVSGRAVRTLTRTFAPGEGVVRWDGRDGRGRAAPAGTYFYRLEGAGDGTVRKMILRP